MKNSAQLRKTFKPILKVFDKKGQYLKATGICSVLLEISAPRIPRCCGELDHILGNLIIKYPQSQTWYCYFSDVNTHTAEADPDLEFIRLQL